MALTFVTAGIEAGETTSWPADVEGFVEPAPGEHPRLLFRKSDLPALRKKAETPEGQAILARLCHILGNNGEKLPEKVSPATKGYPGPGKYRSLSITEPGYLTLGHPAGYGLLYQLTGDEKYADLGKQAFEKMINDKVRDVDSRYSFIGPNGELRSGSSWAIAALGYDLCYEGWDEAFRRKMVETFLTVQIEQYPRKQADLKKVVTKPKYRPSKNHYGGIMCGAVAAAAIMGDPGTEGVDIEGEWLPAAFENTRAMFTEGFGDHGFYSEGHGPSHVSSDTGLMVWLAAARNACGKDFYTDAPGEWLTLRWVMELVPTQHGARVMDRKSSAGRGYGTEAFTRIGYWSHSGQFAQGFGCISEDKVPAALWVYRNFVEPAELVEKPTFAQKRLKKARTAGWIKPGERSYDAFMSPWHAVCSFVNWPVGVEPVNPAELMPRAIEDRVHGYYVFRNRWQDGNDILVSALLGYGPKDAYRPKRGPIYLWGLGQKFSFGKFLSDGPATFVRGERGGVVSTGSQCLAVDFSGKSGAPLLMALVGIDGPDTTARGGELLSVNRVKSGGTEVVVVTLQDGEAPPVKVEGNRVVVGKQTVSVDGNRIVLGE
jgi:hypothetical protein